MKIKFVVKRFGRRRRVILYVDDIYIAGWWLESARGVAYNPFKPVPPRAWNFIQMLSNDELEKLYNWLITADDGDEMEITKRV